MLQSLIYDRFLFLAHSASRSKIYESVFENIKYFSMSSLRYITANQVHLKKHSESANKQSYRNNLHIILTTF